MFARRAEFWIGRIKHQTVLILMIAIGPIQAEMAFLPAQHQTMRVAIEGVLFAVGGSSTATKTR